MLPGSVTDAAFDAAPVAVLGNVPGQLPTAVNDAACASVPMLGQLSVCAAPAPVTVQPAVAVLHVNVAPFGSGSLIVALFAGPGPLLVNTMVKVAVWPAVIVPPSGVLAIT